MTPKKRLPGQTNADYEGHLDPNVEFLTTESINGGGDYSAVYRAVRAFMLWRLRRRGGRTWSSG